MKNDNYTVDQLIHSDSFRRMVKGTASPQETKEWSVWIEESESNRRKAKQAVSEIAGFGFKAPESPDVQEEWAKLSQKITGSKQNTRSRVLGHWLFRVAALLAIVSLVGIGIYASISGNPQATQLQAITNDTTVETSQNEQKTIKFTDGSKIILSGNTKATFSLGVMDDIPIEVVLDGKAYFVAVDNNSDESRFEVKTPNGTIRDIGTKFLVEVESALSRVVLQEGHVAINMSDQQQSEDLVHARKGQLIEFNNRDVLQKESVNPTFYTSWASGFMEFEETTFKEFANYIEERYDLQVKFSRQEIKNIKLNGAVYYRSINELVKSVGKVSNIPVYRSEDRKKLFIGTPKGIRN